MQAESGLCRYVHDTAADGGRVSVSVSPGHLSPSMQLVGPIISERVRTPASLGRDLQVCHPPPCLVKIWAAGAWAEIAQVEQSRPCSFITTRGYSLLSLRLLISNCVSGGL